MQNVILAVHILACIALTAVVLLQRSEGGALGIGGGGPGGGIMSGRGAAGALVRTTMIFAGVFFLTSLTLTTIAARNEDGRTAIERRLDDETAPAEGLADGRDPTVPLLPSDPLLENSDAGLPDATLPSATDPLFEAPITSEDAPETTEDTDDETDGSPDPQ